MKKVTKRSKTSRPATGSEVKTYKPGTVLQYIHNESSAYRIQVVAQIGRVIFAHSVFTTGLAQRCGTLQVLDIDGLDSVTVEKEGQPWEQRKTPCGFSSRSHIRYRKEGQ